MNEAANHQEENETLLTSAGKEDQNHNVIDDVYAELYSKPKKCENESSKQFLTNEQKTGE